MAWSEEFTPGQLGHDQNERGRFTRLLLGKISPGKEGASAKVEEHWRV